ncbi:uncharacterized protein [Nicotiana sylvestris]|uniref:uncharacterized protein n=1 Tax=Nicotiana sylvestris TaxID=4096 RepID=UPI00388C4324
MRDLFREQNLKQKVALPSDTIANPRGSGSGPTSHIMAITTRSGKVLQGEGEQVVEVEESEQGVEVEEPSVVEVEKIQKICKCKKRTGKRKVDDSKLKKFYDILKQLSVNIPFVEAFQEMSGFAKYLKDLITKKRTTKNEVVNVTHQVSSIIATSTVQNKEDPGAFTIPCTIGARDFARGLCDNVASINLMPLAIYKQVRLGMPRPTSMRLQMADRSIERPVGIVDDVLVKVGKFHLPADFVILDCAVDKEIPIILGRPFLATGRALMDSERNEIKFNVNDEEVTFQASKGMKLPHEYESISVIDVVDEVEDAVEMKMEKQCLGKALAAILVEQLLDVLKEHRKAIGWTIADIRGIPPGICEHKIQLENDTKPSVEHQRQLNPSMQEVVKKEIIKWLDFGVVYPIADSSWPNAVWFVQSSGYFSKMHDVHLLLHGGGLSRGFHGRFFAVEKYHFMVDEGIVLAHKILKHGIEVDRAKIEIISILPPPTSVKSVRSFLGHAGFYRNFIKDFSKIANPMCKLLEKDAKFLFDEKCLKAVEELKQKLTTAPIIVTPDWSLTFELMCDASGVAIGAMLGQRHNKKFRAYLLGSKVIVYTDHAALRYLMAKKDAKPRLIRWVLLLQEFDLEVKDRNGTQNQVADHLSRLEEAGRPKEDLDINDAFPDEHLLALSSTFAPWRDWNLIKKEVFERLPAILLGRTILVSGLC